MLLNSRIGWQRPRSPNSWPIRPHRDRHLLDREQESRQTWKDCYFGRWHTILWAPPAPGAPSDEQIRRLSDPACWWCPSSTSSYRSYSLYLTRLQNEKEQAEKERCHAEEMASIAPAHHRGARPWPSRAKDQTTHDHLRRVQVYCVEMARILNLSDEDRRALQAASLLHDIVQTRRARTQSSRGLAN